MKNIFKNNFDQLVSNLTYPEFIKCLVEFCKNRKFVKTNLHAVELIRQSIPRVAELAKWQPIVKKADDGSQLMISSSVPTVSTPGTGIPTSQQLANKEEESNFKFWFPILFGFYEVVMTCDLEVRTRLVFNFLYSET